MGIAQRRILGKANPLDDRQVANAVDGGDDSLSARQDYIAPLNVAVTDQGSQTTLACRRGLDDALIDAKSRSNKFVGDGAAGVALSGADEAR